MRLDDLLYSAKSASMSAMVKSVGRGVGGLQKTPMPLKPPTPKVTVPNMLKTRTVKPVARPLIRNRR